MHRPTSTLFPYTTLFRSRAHELEHADAERGEMRAQKVAARAVVEFGETPGEVGGGGAAALDHRHAHQCPERDAGAALRSEEHTSELQSQSNRVCRLLHEK